LENGGQERYEGFVLRGLPLHANLAMSLGKGNLGTLAGTVGILKLWKLPQPRSKLFLRK